MSTPLPKTRKELHNTTIGNGQYAIIEQIGAGSFGHVFRAKDTKTQEDRAIKIEPKTLAIRPLKHEVHVYRKLHPDPKHGPPCRGVLPVLAFLETPTDLVMVVELLGHSLSYLSEYCARKLSLKSTCMLACETISMLEDIHNKGYVHRDVKPGNVMVDGQTRSRLRMIDFGMAKSYLNKDGSHRKLETGKGMNGTARYASGNAHKGMEQSRRDDLESLGYMILYLAKGRLPWQSNRGEFKTKEEENAYIMKMKCDETLMSETCSGMALSPAINEHIKYCKALDYEADPDYGYLRGLYVGLMRHYSYAQDSQYDWLSMPLPADVLYASDEADPIRLAVRSCGPPTLDGGPGDGWFPEPDPAAVPAAQPTTPKPVETAPAPDTPQAAPTPKPVADTKPAPDKVPAKPAESSEPASREPIELDEDEKRKDKGGGCNCIIS